MEWLIFLALGFALTFSMILGKLLNFSLSFLICKMGISLTYLAHRTLVGIVCDNRCALFIFILFNLFILLLLFFWLHWVFVAVCGLSLVAASGGCS